MLEPFPAGTPGTAPPHFCPFALVPGSRGKTLRANAAQRALLGHFLAAQDFVELAARPDQAVTIWQHRRLTDRRVEIVETDDVITARFSGRGACWRAILPADSIKVKP